MDVEIVSLGDETGQSLLEFSLMMPVIIGLLVLMVRINTAIQVSIVNQKYARAQTLFLTNNDAIYPVQRLRVSSLDMRGENRMVIGVSENTADAAGNFRPEAVVQNVDRKKAPLRCDTDEAGLEFPEKRRCVRVRTTVSLCAPQVVIGNKPLLSHRDLGRNSPPGQRYIPDGEWQLRDDTKFAFCKGRI